MPVAERGKTKVLYIGGIDRSGSTLLTKVLNEARGFFGVNELALIGFYGLKLNQSLSNGDLFKESKLWNDILVDAYREVPEEKVLNFYTQPGPKIERLVFNGLYPTSKPNENYLIYKNNLAKLYRSIQKVTGCSVIVDSSKTPEYAWVLAEIADIDLHVIHLSRDPRGVFYSLRKSIHRQDVDAKRKVRMKQQNLLRFSAKYTVWNIVLGRLKKKAASYVRVRYEDFVERPQETVDRIFNTIGKSPQQLFEAKNVICFKKKDYGIWGNPMRNTTGRLKVLPDLAWKSQLPLRYRLLVVALTFPILTWLGYSKRSSKRAVKR